MCLKQQRGKAGEDLACKYLEKNNYKIIERNFYCRQGEIDIIAEDKNTKEFVFIEVKTRTNLHYGRPAEGVDSKKQKHIYNAGEYYLYKNKLKKFGIRIDVIEIYIKDNSYKVNHIKQAITTKVRTP
jgi:putative endonuclease